MRNGEPVVVAATIEMNLRLLGNPNPDQSWIITAPKVVHRVEPKYSKEARKARLEGTVVLAVDVGADGKANDVTVRRGLGMGLDEEAVKAVKKWRFLPAKKGIKPLEFTTTVEVTFRIR